MNTLFSGCLVLSGLTGLTIYLLGMIAPKETVAGPQDFSTAKVTPSVVVVRELPSFSSQDFPQKSSKKMLIPQLIPGGLARLARIKRDPRSVPEGRAAAKANYNIKSSPPPKLFGVNGSKLRAVTSTYNCVGNPVTGVDGVVWAPSNSSGAVGLNNYVEVTNIHLGIYSKTSCTNRRFVSLKQFLRISDVNTVAIAPQAMYDFQNNRYVVTSVAFKSSSTDVFQYLAVSRTGDPLGAWNIYRIPLSEGTYKFCKKALTDVWDFQTSGYNKNQWFITANNFPSSGDVYGTIMTIDKAPTLTGSVPVLRCYGTSSSSSRRVLYNVAAPIDRGTGDTAYFLSPGYGSGDNLLKYALNTATGAMTYNTPIAIPAWTAAPDASQPGTSNLLFTQDGRFQSHTTQIGRRVYAIHAINVNGFSAIRLYKVNAGANTAVEAFTYAPANLDVFNPSFAMANTANSTSSFFAFNYSSSTQNPSAGLASRRNDGIGDFSVIGYQEGAPITNTCQRGNQCYWGYWSATSLDPQNLNSAFGVTQFMTGNGEFDWSTKIMGLRP